MSFYDDNTLLPLYKAEVRGDNGAKWKFAYEALKHDRYGSIREGNIGNLLNALGALYILNLYYADKTFTIGVVGLGIVNDSTEYDSKIFDTKYAYAINVDWKDSIGDESIIWNDNDDLNGSIYITKISDDDFKKHHFNWCLAMRKAFKSDLIQTFLKEHPEYAGKSVEEMCLQMGGKQFLNAMVGDITSLEYGTKIKMVLNKGLNIYPHLDKIDDTILDKEIGEDY